MPINNNTSNSDNNNILSLLQDIQLNPLASEEKLAIDTNNYTAMEKLWESIAQAEIPVALQENKLDKLKFYLGPALFQLEIQKQYESSILDWEIFKAQCNKSFFEKIKAGLDIIQQIIRYDILFDLDIFLQSEQAEFGQLIDSFDVLKQKNANELIKCYQSWAFENKKLLKHQDVISWYKKITSTQVKEKISEWNLAYDEILSEWAYQQYQDDLAKIYQVSKTDLGFNFIRDFFNNNLESIVQANSLEKIVQEQSKVCANFLKKLQEKSHVCIKQFELKKMVEIKAYKDLANKYLAEQSHLLPLKNILTGNKGYQGLSPTELVDKIIEINSVKEIEINHQLFYDLKNNNESLRKELEKHYLSPRLEQSFTLAKEFHILPDELNNINTKLATKITKALHNMVENSAYRLATLVAQPLEWWQLKNLLLLLRTESEAQVLLQKILFNYLCMRDTQDVLPQLNSIICFDKKTLEQRRRQVEYLISCLYMSVKERMDEGILFFAAPYANDSYWQEPKRCIGVNLIVNHIKEEEHKNSELEKSLSGFLNKIAANEVAYFAADKLAQPNSLMVKNNLIEQSKFKNSIKSYSKPRNNALFQFGIYKPSKLLSLEELTDLMSALADNETPSIK